MTEWGALLLLLATYALAFVASGSAPPARPRRPQFDPILPTPKRVPLRLLRGALLTDDCQRGDRDPAAHLTVTPASHQVRSAS